MQVAEQKATVRESAQADTWLCLRYSYNSWQRFNCITRANLSAIGKKLKLSSHY